MRDRGSGNDRRGPAPVPVVRCAVYTRKSTEEGLEQEFNSLDAQREAAEAYIRSQRHQGWTLIPTTEFRAANLGCTLIRR